MNQLILELPGGDAALEAHAALWVASGGRLRRVSLVDGAVTSAPLRAAAEVRAVSDDGLRVLVDEEAAASAVLEPLSPSPQYVGTARNVRSAVWCGTRWVVVEAARVAAYDAHAAHDVPQPSWVYPTSSDRIVVSPDRDFVATMAVGRVAILRVDDGTEQDAIELDGATIVDFAADAAWRSWVLSTVPGKQLMRAGQRAGRWVFEPLPALREATTALAVLADGTIAAAPTTGGLLLRRRREDAWQRWAWPPSWAAALRLLFVPRRGKVPPLLVSVHEDRVVRLLQPT